MIFDEASRKLYDRILDIGEDHPETSDWVIWNPEGVATREVHVFRTTVLGEAIKKMLDAQKEIGGILRMKMLSEVPTSYAKSDGAPFKISEMITSRRVRREREKQEAEVQQASEFKYITLMDVPGIISGSVVKLNSLSDDRSVAVVETEAGISSPIQSTHVADNTPTNRHNIQMRFIYAGRIAKLEEEIDELRDKIGDMEFTGRLSVSSNVVVK